MGDAYDRKRDMLKRVGLAGDALRELYEVPDHFAACADELRYIAGKIDAGTSPEDLAQRVVNLGRIMGRRA